ncbi:MAG: hypothetical protein C5S48_02085 [Candidatus Methanogaster sp.]|nr:MAG: hypothetical protein C5S48_02085 [ANME-2 cluster archaeon]
MLSDSLIAADAVKNDNGEFFNLIGVAVAYKSYHKFRKEYFEITEDFIDKYNLNFDYRVLKTADLKNNIPTYSLSDAIRELVGQILQSKQISTIFITETYFEKSIKLFNEEIKGVKFARNELSQYYPIIPLWRYYHNSNTDEIRHTVIDGIQGKITKAWEYVGKKSSKVSIIPHGDQTHPCLSTADLVCGYAEIEIFPPYQREIYAALKDITTARVKTEFISDAFEDHLVPKYKYSLKPETLFPHPVILVKSTQSENKKILPETAIFKKLLRYAEKRGGCVAMENLNDHHRILKDEDIIVCIDDAAFKEMHQIQQLNRGRDFKVLNLDDTYQLLENSLR